MGIGGFTKRSYGMPLKLSGFTGGMPLKLSGFTRRCDYLPLTF